MTSEYCGSLMARFMNSAQMGAAASAPWSLTIGVVVVADPDDADEVGGVAGEPGVVAGSGLAGGRGGEATASDAGSRAVVHDAFEQGLGEVGGARIHHLFRFRRVVGDDVAIGVADGGEHPRGEVDAAVGEDRIGAGHVDGSCVVGAEATDGVPRAR